MYITIPAWIDSLLETLAPRTAEDHLRAAIALAHRNVLCGGGPFGAVVARADGALLGAGVNLVMQQNNSMLHAEIVALMMAEQRVGSYSLAGGDGAILYTSCEPCAMCLGGALWSGVSAIISSATREDALDVGFEEGPVFAESYAYLQNRGVRLEYGLLRQEGQQVLREYQAIGGRLYNARE